MKEKTSSGIPAWIGAAFLLFLGLAIFFLAPGYSFSAYICFGLAALIACYQLLALLERREIALAKALRTALSICVCVGVLLAAVTGTLIWNGSLGDPGVDCEYIIVLGAGVNGSVPSLTLRQRINAAYDYLVAHPEAICIASGGQGPDEDISEAACMFRELTAMGIDESRIWMEDQSTSTMENLEFSLAVIEEKTGSRPIEAAIVSSEYHLFRAGLMAETFGLTAYGVPADSQWFSLRLNYHLREIAAVWAYLIFGG